MTDIEKLYKLLKGKKKLVAMLAPSFPVDFEYPKVIWQLKTLGFDKVVELTFGAKMVNSSYHKIIKEDKDRVWIASPCPTTVLTIQTKFPSLRKNLIPVVSPMVSMARICEKYFPKHLYVFIGPCITKKVEAKQNKEVAHAITFKELKEIFDEKDLWKVKERKNTFDKFYNDYTKIYPLGGGLSSTLHTAKILKDSEILIVDGHDKTSKVFEKIEKGQLKRKRFIDCLDCKGGCIGGPGVASDDPIKEKKKKIIAYRDYAWKCEKDKGRTGKIAHADGVDFSMEY